MKLDLGIIKLEFIFLIVIYIKFNYLMLITNLFVNYHL